MTGRYEEVIFNRGDEADFVFVVREKERRRGRRIDNLQGLDWDCRAYEEF